MCISCEMHDKWPPFIEFIVWFILQGLSVGNHFGVWVVLQSHLIDITNATYRNATIKNLTTTTTFAPITLNGTGFSIANHTQQPDTTETGIISSSPKPVTTSFGNEEITRSGAKMFSIAGSFNTFVSNFSSSVNTTFQPFQNATTTKIPLIIDQTPEEQWATLLDFREILLVFCIVGATLYVVHTVMLLPNIIQSCRVNDPVSLKDTGNLYFRSRLKIHALMLVISTIVFDIPAGCLTMEILSLIWEGPLTDEDYLFSYSKVILGLSLTGLAFIALYKGMMPLFLWIGNPFCFPCIPLRLLIVFPGGIIAMVMTFGPVMGVAKNRLLQFAPEVIKDEIEGLASTFFSIGMIFWIIFLISLASGICCWYKVCREGADANVCSLCC